MERNKLTAMMIVHNEEHRYLRMCLDHLSRYVDNMVILDDCSTDRTYDICSSYPKVELLERNDMPMFWENEALLRMKLWNLTLRTKPQWIIALDADEMMEDRIIQERDKLLAGDHIWVEFRLFEFWGNMTHYRVDKMWNPYNRWGIYLFRYREDLKYVWNNQPLHCGRVPMNLRRYQGIRSDLRLRHYGWANKAEHLLKYQRYIERDPKGKYSPLAHYYSILDPNPQLHRWTEPKVNTQNYILVPGGTVTW